MINVFTVDPSNQQRLIDLLTQSTNKSVRYAPVFIAATLHRSIDGTKVTMYEKWRSEKDYQKMREDTSRPPFLQEALSIAKFDPGMYEVVQTFTPSNKHE